jgi:hypothetical protein
VELASYRPLGAWSSEVVPMFMENISTPAIRVLVVDVLLTNTVAGIHIQEIPCSNIDFWKNYPAEIFLIFFTPSFVNFGIAV